MIVKRILFMVFLFPIFAMASQVSVTSIKLTSSTLPTRLTIKLNHATEYRLFTLEHPYRLVIDLEHTTLRAKIPYLSDATIKSFRKGQFNPNTLRLVLDLNKPVRYNNYFRPETREFILDMYPVASYPMPSKKFSHVTPQLKKSPAIKKIKAYRPRTTIIVIDAGHGGKDTGAIGVQGSFEKAVVLGIAQHLANRINQEPHMQAILTRGGDYFVPLRDRLSVARRGKADVFISIHADSYSGEKASGVSVFALSARGASSEAARLLADKENNSVLDGLQFTSLIDQSKMLRSVLIDLAQTATINSSVHLGRQVLGELHKVAHLHIGRVEQAPFVVLKSPDIPSILVEMGFLSNPKEEAALRNVRYQTKLANAMFTGIHHYLKKYPPTG